MATIIVEDGSIVANANSYVSEAELSTYAADRGITLSGTPNQLIIKSMDYTESRNFIGDKYTQGQSLQWPRDNAYIDGFEVGTDTIPQELKNAQLATAISIDAGVDPSATIERATKREKLDVLEVEYQDNAASFEIIRSINNAFSKLIRGGTGIGSVSVWRI